MSENYDAKLCEEIHKNINKQINSHSLRLDEHDGRLDKLEQRGAAVDIKMDSLCDQIKSLVNIMKWYIGLTVGALVSFFFYTVQQGIFK